MTSGGTTSSYIAPKVLSESALTTKSDVYSYGMVLFEIISEIRDCKNGQTTKSFPTRDASVITAGGHDILSILDGRLARNADEEEVSIVCKVACCCIHDDPKQRPSMEQVTDVLEGVSNDDIFNLPPISVEMH
ncbi:hypothetical protein Pfo_013936 [Paulownia fortunei]|nr:hypothetical protein Pfo_013936 [Paulownia fortunei]